LRINQGAPDDGGNVVDQRVMHAAVWDVNHAVGISLEQSELGRAQPASNGEPCAVPKAGCCPGNYRDLWQAVVARELIERSAGGGRNTALTEAWAARTWRPMRA
jgi:hypothetical protein